MKTKTEIVLTGIFGGVFFLAGIGIIALQVLGYLSLGRMEAFFTNRIGDTVHR